MRSCVGVEDGELGAPRNVNNLSVIQFFFFARALGENGESRNYSQQWLKRRRLVVDAVVLHAVQGPDWSIISKNIPAHETFLVP